jgi:IS5 family transposase
MLRLYNRQSDFFEAALPPELQGLPPELAAMDEILNDATFVKPFEAAVAQKVNQDVFSWFEGRPTTALASYVRLMVLKFRRGWSYEELLGSVNESVFLRRFCGYTLSDRLPDDTTLIKLTGRLGEDFIKVLNRAIVKEAKERKIVKGRRMRLDTTVAPANIKYPTDTGLLGDGVRIVGRLIKRIKEQGAAKAVGFRDRWHRAKKILRRLGQGLKSKGQGAKSLARAAKKKLIRMAQGACDKGRQVQEWVKDHKDGVVQDLSEALAHYLALLQKIIEQSQKVLAGQTSLPDRIVSLFDHEARPIERGKLFPKVEFGYKALFQEAEGDIVTGYEAFVGNPNDGSLLVDAVKEHKSVLGTYPEDLAGDRGFQQNPQDKSFLGERINKISIPMRGNVHDPPQRRRQRTKWFWRLQRWRAGGEATGSLLKRKYGWGLSLMRGLAGANTWLGYGVLAHNLWRMARITNSS